MTDLVHLMRNDTDLSSLAAFVRNEIRSTLALQRAFEAIDFHIDGPSDLPSLAQHPNTMEAYLSYTGSDSSSAKHYNTDGRVPNN